MCSTCFDDAVTALEVTLDLLTADEPAAGDGARLDRVRRLVAAQNRLAAQLTAAVRDAEAHQSSEHDGLKSMKSWLLTHTRLSNRAVGQVVGNGRALDLLPAVESAFVSGRLTADQVAVIAPITATQRLDRAAEQGVDLAEIEGALVALAVEQPHRRLQEAVGYYERRLDPDGVEPDPTEGRSLTMSRLLGGMWQGTFVLDAVGGEKVASAIESIAAASRCAGDLRTAAQTRGDALVQLADLALASGELPVLRTVKPHVIVTIGADDLADPAPGHTAGRTGMGALISASRARWLACDSKITRLLLGRDGLPLDIGRDERVVPPHLRRAVVERDRNCVFAGCEAPSWFCDVHHVLEWINDGETSLDNSALLCERHHTKVHHGFSVVRDDGAPPGRRWRTWRPDGTEILIHAPLLAA